MQAQLVFPEGELCPGETYTVEAFGQIVPIVGFSWEMISGPAGGSITFANEQDTQSDFSVNVAGQYRIRYCYFARNQ